MKKLPSQLSNEELQALLAERPKEEAREPAPEDYKNDVLGFAAFFKLERGDNYISNKKLYALYRQWSEDPVSQSTCTRTLLDFLPKHNQGFLINQEAIRLSTRAHALFLPKRRTKTTKSHLHQKRFHAFITTYKIKKGTTAVPVCALYQFYLEWAAGNPSRKMSENTFLAFCNLTFSTKFSGNGIHWVKLDPSIFEVFPRERVFSIHESRRLEFLQRKKAKNKASKV